MSVCMYVFVSVIKVVIVNTGRSIRFFVFLHKIEWLGMVLRILNLEGHHNSIIDSKVTATLTAFLSMIK